MGYEVCGLGYKVWGVRQEVIGGGVMLLLIIC